VEPRAVIIPEGATRMSFAFAWSQELATGNSKIDDQHKLLFAAANELFNACQIGKERQEVERTMYF